MFWLSWECRVSRDWFSFCMKTIDHGIRKFSAHKPRTQVVRRTTKRVIGVVYPSTRTLALDDRRIRAFDAIVIRNRHWAWLAVLPARRVTIQGRKWNWEEKRRPVCKLRAILPRSLMRCSKTYSNTQHYASRAYIPAVKQKVSALV